MKNEISDEKNIEQQQKNIIPEILNVSLKENYYQGKNTIPFYSHTKLQNCFETNHLNFYSHLDNRIFSNLYPCKIKINDEFYDSTEHYFQMYKYDEGERNFMKLLNTSQVAQFGQRRMIIQKQQLELLNILKNKQLIIPINSVTNKEYQIGDKVNPQLKVKDWDKVKIGVMMEALRQKFYFNEEFKSILIATNNSWLIEHTINDFQWQFFINKIYFYNYFLRADGGNGNGKNFLGKLLMIVRQEINDQKQYDPYKYWEFLNTSMNNFIDYTKK